jgi:excisionase family DNA binding protein
MNNIRKNPPVIMTTQEAATVVGLSIDTIRKSIQSGELTASRPGKRKLLITYQNLVNWIEKGRENL